MLDPNNTQEDDLFVSKIIEDEEYLFDEMSDEEFNDLDEGKMSDEEFNDLFESFQL